MRIWLFEEIVDFYNVRMAADERLHPVIRQINQIHHQEEVRHIAFGRQIVSLLYNKITIKSTKAQRQDLEKMLKNYLIYNLNVFYNPYVFQDVGIQEPLSLRHQLIQHNTRHELEREVIAKPMAFLMQMGVFNTDISLSRKDATYATI